MRVERNYNNQRTLAVNQKRLRQQAADPKPYTPRADSRRLLATTPPRRASLALVPPPLPLAPIEPGSSWPFSYNSMSHGKEKHTAHTQVTKVREDNNANVAAGWSALGVT